MKTRRKAKPQLLSSMSRSGRRSFKVKPAQATTERARKPSGEELHFLQTLIDTIPNPVFYKDVNNLYLGCNNAFGLRLGLRKEDVIGKSAYDIFPKEMAEKYHGMDLELLNKPGEQAYEDTLLYADGKPHDVIVKKATFTNALGDLAGLVGVTVDITERKRAERELREAHDQLEIRVRERTAQLARAVEELRMEIAERKRMEEALQESSEKLKLFAYSVMHDLKSPMMGISGLTGLLKRQYGGSLDERGKKYCEQILKATEHLAVLVEKINIYITAKELPLTIEEIDMQALFRDVEEEFSALLVSRGVKWVAADSVPSVRADRLSLHRVLRNLVDNALKYGGQGLSRIEIGYEETEGLHEFRVSDDGAGIKKENCEKIFRPFQRNANSKGTEGAGLGLAIVKEIIQRHGGDVWAQPAGDRGTTFHLTVSKNL